MTLGAACCIWICCCCCPPVAAAVAAVVVTADEEEAASVVVDGVWMLMAAAAAAAGERLMTAAPPLGDISRAPGAACEVGTLCSVKRSMRFTKATYKPLKMEHITVKRWQQLKFKLNKNTEDKL